MVIGKPISAKIASAKKKNKNYYRVEAVMDDRVIDGKKEYLIKWENYDLESWKGLEDLRCDQLIEEYEKNKGFKFSEKTITTKNEKKSGDPAINMTRNKVDKIDMEVELSHSVDAIAEKMIHRNKNSVKWMDLDCCNEESRKEEFESGNLIADFRKSTVVPILTTEEGTKLTGTKTKLAEGRHDPCGPVTRSQVKRSSLYLDVDPNNRLTRKPRDDQQRVIPGEDEEDSNERKIAFSREILYIWIIITTVICALFAVRVLLGFRSENADRLLLDGENEDVCKPNDWF